MLKALVVIAVIAAAGYGAAEIVAQRYAEKQIAAFAAKRNPLTGDVTAQVSFPLLWDLWSTSTIRGVKLSTNTVPFGILSGEAWLEAAGVHLDRPATVRSRKPVVTSVDRLEASVEISESQLSKLLPSRIKFDIRPGLVSVVGPGFEVDGRFALSGGKLRFQPAGGRRLPPGVGVGAWSVPRVPFLSCAENLQTRRNALRVSCSVDHPRTPQFLG